MNKHHLSPTLEDYLEAIYRISEVNKVARSKEIAGRLQVKMSSVTIALRSLAEKGLVNYEARSYITLTPKGFTTAKCIDRRHHVLYDFFTKVLGMASEESDTAACTMEHGMPAEACKKLTALLLSLQRNPDLEITIKTMLEEAAMHIDCSTDCDFPLAQKEGGEGAMVDLNLLSPGESGSVVEIRGNGVLKKRLLELGIVRDQIITAVRAAPLDDPIEIKVRNANLSLRREEASMILVRKR